MCVCMVCNSVDVMQHTEKQCAEANNGKALLLTSGSQTVLLWAAVVLHVCVCGGGGEALY